MSCYLSWPTLVIVIHLAGFALMIGALVRLGSTCHRFWTMVPVTYLGEVSYSLYMTHTLAQKVVYKLLPSGRFEEASELVKVGILVVYAILILACCLLSYYLVERPSRKLLKRLMKPGLASGTA